MLHNVIGVLVSRAINALHKSSDGGENLVCGLVQMKGFGSSFHALTQPRMSPSKGGYLAHESFSESIPPALVTTMPGNQSQVGALLFTLPRWAIGARLLVVSK